MLRKIRVRKHERGLWFRYGDFVRLADPGGYRLWSRLWSRSRTHIEVVNLLDTRFEHELLDVVVENPQVRELVRIVDLNDDQRALVWRDGRLFDVVGPGRHAFWEQPYELSVEVFDVRELYLRHEKAQAIALHEKARPWLDVVDVDAKRYVLLFRDGELLEQLRPGRYLIWRLANNLSYEVIEAREKTEDITGQEIMTSDKVTLRINLIVTYQVVDPVRAVTVVRDAEQALYREAQLGLRAAVGSRTLDELLTGKDAVSRDVSEALRERAIGFGIEVRSVGLRDIILPGDMKVILNQVIEAEKRAQANLIRRREETAAARSQANTAKLLADNPILARFKELEALQEILSGAKATFVLGRGDLAAQLRSLVDSERDGEPAAK